MTIFAILIAATLAVGILLGALARLPIKERVFQLLAMTAAAVIFFGLVKLVESAAH